MTNDDADQVSEVPSTGAHEVQVIESRTAHIGALSVRRALPNKGRRMVGAWCFIDHMGPEPLSVEHSIDVAPHPHAGLQTVTWLFSGEFLHRDSLGSEQLIRPGQLNLMSAGFGVAHSEENPGLTYGQLHGIQLWVAQPSTTRDGATAFEHHGELPRLELDNAAVTVLVGEFAGAHSRARRDSDHVGIELDMHGGDTTFSLDPAYEYALVVASGAVLVDTQVVTPGHLAYLDPGRDECRLSTKGPVKAVLVGGQPFAERVLMWWNFVARTQDEIAEMWLRWAAGDERFGDVASPVAPIEVAPPPWVLQNS
jgi:redox-sensitive bicupin YhaK (pirin superfamily)